MQVLAGRGRLAERCQCLTKRPFAQGRVVQIPVASAQLEPGLAESHRRFGVMPRQLDLGQPAVGSSEQYPDARLLCHHDGPP